MSARFQAKKPTARAPYQASPRHRPLTENALSRPPDAHNPDTSSLTPLAPTKQDLALEAPVGQQREAPSHHYSSRSLNRHRLGGLTCWGCGGAIPGVRECLSRWPRSVDPHRPAPTARQGAWPGFMHATSPTRGAEATRSTREKGPFGPQDPSPRTKTSFGAEDRFGRAAPTSSRKIRMSRFEGALFTERLREGGIGSCRRSRQACPNLGFQFRRPMVPCSLRSPCR